MLVVVVAVVLKKMEGQSILTVIHSASRLKDAIFVESVPTTNMYSLTVAPGDENRFSSDVWKIFLLFLLTKTPLMRH